MPWRRLPDAPKDAFDALRGKARILVDESLGPDVASFLRDRGCNLVYAGDVGLAGKSDDAIAAYAWRVKRMIWTHDRDFLDESVVPEQRNPGVVILPGGDGGQQAMIAGLTTALTVFAHGREAWSKTKSTIEANGELVMRSRGGEKGAGGATRYNQEPDFAALNPSARYVMAGPVPAIHDLLLARIRRGCPAQGRA